MCVCVCVRLLEPSRAFSGVLLPEASQAEDWTAQRRGAKEEVALNPPG